MATSSVVSTVGRPDGSRSPVLVVYCTSMPTKITFLGAGSTVFAKNVLGDALLQPSLHDAKIALYDVDATRLDDSKRMIEAINRNENRARATITAHLGVGARVEALRDAKYVVNAIQVGGYEPCTVTDFEVPKRYGLRQTIGDTIGIGGLFRTLRTLPVLLDVARDMERVCSDAWLLNYTNPMCAVTAGLLMGSNVRTVGLCHSVQVCVPMLLAMLGLDERYPVEDVDWSIAGINHQAWLLRASYDGRDLYPEIKSVAGRLVDRVCARGGGAWARSVLEKCQMPSDEPCYAHPFWAQRGARKGWISEDEARDVAIACDLVRLELLSRFGFYLTESSEHTAEYTPWFIKSGRPDLVEKYNIPLDEYPSRCRHQIAAWERQRSELAEDPNLRHAPSNEFGAYIMHAMETNQPYEAAGNVMNEGWIKNLPSRACVEVPCRIDANGIHPTVVGALPEPCAALNRTNIGTQILAVDAVLHRSRDHVYQAALLDPHTAAELSVDETVALCDDLIEAHGDWLPELR